MVFLILLFFLISPHSVFATPQVKISAYSATNPEYVELTNNSSIDIDLNGWVIRDDNSYTTDDIFLTSSDIIPANSNKKFTNSKDSTWLNDGGDIIYLYDSSNNEIDKLTYPIPTPTSIPTSTPTPTTIPTPTNIPTPDPTVTNPTDSSSIKLTEFMPYESTEWLEFYNSNNYPVKLVSWKMEDKDGHTRNIGNNGVLSIGATSYTVFGYSAFFDNTNAETVIIRDQNNSVIAQTSYDAGLRTRDQSWSLINGKYCQSSITQGYENVTSCYSAPTAAPTPTLTKTPTPTPDQSKYTSSDTATESAIIEPTSEPNFITPDFEPTTVPTSGTILGDDISSTTKKNYLPLILIISGGLLLTSPLFFSKFKK